MAVWSWTGFYIGGDVGGTWARDRFDHSPFFAQTGLLAGVPIDAAALTTAASPTLKGSGFSGGAPVITGRSAGPFGASRPIFRVWT
jgi:hypothetical protein